ncbi:MAG TPA: tRNA (adenosine(37)-N6)-dimethylallyltransferase MiaA, partial [Burkholderiaceae bacterium]|nr:tRNA (adenosine(37)-N6)-dimethylallyltransferase MiaA [Burkholderiaceae bacterium]
QRLELVTMDSAQGYRGMDIGTAKPSMADRLAVAHHLLDVRDPNAVFSAAQFAQEATGAIDEIRQRGHVPLIVGGTMLYAKALREGLSDLPPADPSLRQQLNQEAKQRGWPALHARLAVVDPPCAARLAPTDSQRIARALEVYELTGVALSALHAQTSARKNTAAMPMMVLMPPNRDTLHARIAQRFEAMLAQGLVDELRALRARYALDRDLPAMRCVGYRQAWAYLEQECSHAAFVSAALGATRALAKRQLTWLRATKDAQWLDPDDPGACVQTLYDHLMRFESDQLSAHM